MKVSVATTNFNQKNKLAKLYQSLLQNKDYLEVWSLLDDNSTDGSVEMIQEWEKKAEIPMKVIYSKDKTSMSIRHNRIMKNVNDLFILVFGDSYLEAGALKKLSETYVDGTAGSGYRFDVDMNDNILKHDFRYDPDDIVHPEMQRPLPWQAQCGNGFICRKKYMDMIGGFDEAYEGYGYDDYDWFMRLLMNGIKLYAYNNIKVFHHDHPISTVNPNNIKLYANEMSGKGYSSNAKLVTLDFDDFSIEVNNLFYLDQLKKAYPKMKVSMFYIPFDAANFSRLLDFQRLEAAQMIKDRREWIELIPHGITHSGKEMLGIKDDDYETIFKGIEEAFRHYGFPMVMGFKAPHWAYKSNLCDFLDGKGWWLAVDRNQPNQPRALRNYEYTHSIDEPFWLSKQDHIKLHGHISLPSSNNLVDNIMNLMKISPNADWKFVSEVMDENT